MVVGLPTEIVFEFRVAGLPETSGVGLGDGVVGMKLVLSPLRQASSIWLPGFVQVGFSLLGLPFPVFGVWELEESCGYFWGNP